MGKQTNFFHRDASDRLCFEIWAVESAEYATLAAGIAEHFDLTPVGRLVAGFDEVFCEYSDGRSRVGLEWDNWSGLIVVAKTRESETLVREIGEFILRRLGLEGATAT